MDLLSLVIGHLQDTAGSVLIQRPWLHTLVSCISNHPHGVSQELSNRKILIPYHCNTYPIHGRNHIRMMLVNDHNGEVRLVEDGVPLLPLALNTVELVLEQSTLSFSASFLHFGPTLAIMLAV